MPKTTGVVAERLTGDNKQERGELKPGSFWYFKDEEDGEDVGIIFSCPCGCGMLGTLLLKPDVLGQSRPKWTNSGTRDKPTLTPSIGIGAWEPNEMYPRRAEREADGYHWHGFLTDGVWKSV